MFGNKEQIAKSVSPAVNIPVKTIPDDFYAGANPVVQFKDVQKTVELDKDSKSVLSAEEKKAYDKTTAAGAAQKFHPANLLTNRKFLIIGGVILFASIIAGAGLYYWWQAKKTTGQPTPIAVVPAQTQTPEPSVPTTPVEPAIIPPVTETPLVETPIIVPVAVMEFPSILLGESTDMDHDNASDLAEELFDTDPFNSDSDGDKYPDGHELYYLYNPKGVEPQKLIDSGLVKEFTNPTYGFKFYYPSGWAVGNVDPIYQQTLFSTLTGENIEAHAFNLESGQTLADWLALSAPQEKLSDLADFTGYFKTAGKMRKDRLVYYFQDGQRLYVLAYHTVNSSIVNYKVVLEIMARSFRFGEVAPAETAVVEPVAPQVPETMSELIESELTAPTEEETEIIDEEENPPGL